MTEQTKNNLLDALDIADAVLKRLGGFLPPAAERWERMRRDLDADKWEAYFRVGTSGKIEALTGEASAVLLFSSILGDIEKDLKTTSK